MTGSTILIVDDDPDMRLYLRGCLQGLGGAVGLILDASNGEEALTIVQGDAVDLVISDVVLPRLDGASLRGAIRRDPARRHLPILLISGREQPAQPDGPNDAWLSKPFNARQLLAAVERLLAGASP